MVGQLAFEHADGELKASVVAVENALDPDDVVDVEAFRGGSHVVPHLGRDLAAAIGKREIEVRLTVFLRLQLLRSNQETGADDLVFLLRGIADVDFFHAYL